MNNNPAEIDGKIKEQVEIEHSVRRKYPQLWNPVIGDRRNELYHNDALNKAISDNVELIPPYSGHNESYFLSKEMYNAMIKVCRCGRKKENAHLLRCLQKEQKTLGDGQEHSTEYVSKVPNTSFGIYGWPKNRYVEMELSARYVSPTYDMPGGKIGNQPYNNVFIG